MQNSQKIDCDGFPILRDLLLVDGPVEGRHQLVTVLFNNKSYELLRQSDKSAISLRRNVVKGSLVSHKGWLA